MNEIDDIEITESQTEEAVGAMEAPVGTEVAAEATNGMGTQVLYNLLGLLESLLDSVANFLGAHGASILIAILTLAGAWILASVLQSLATKILRAIGLDLIAERTGLRGYLRKHEVVTAPSYAVGWILYFVILYTALVLVLDVLNLGAASSLLRSIAAYLPHLFAAAILILLGFLLGKWADVLVSRSARLAGLPGHKLLGTGARIAVGLLALVFAINSLGWISQSILLGGFALVLGGGLGAAILFALCARGLAESVIARSFVTASFKPGDRLRVGEVEGVLLKIDPCSIRLDCGDRITVLPNRRLVSETVDILNPSQKP